MKTLFALTAVLSLAVAANAGEPVSTSTWVRFSSFRYSGTATERPHAGEYLNPILSGFYPDPSICRAGDDYYLVNSSFQYFPGLPVWHSKDLVHWTQIANAIDRPSQYPARGGPVSAGMYAPTIRYHDGTYYIVCTLIGSHGGNFYITARTPKGPWSDPVFLRGIGGMDPSLFFDDDGRCYLTNCDEPPNHHAEYNGHRTIRLQEIDLAHGRPVGEQTILVNGGTDISKHPVWCEGPHLYKINNTYYLMAAQGGTGPAHSEVIFKSMDLRGPYVPSPDNPMVSARDLASNRPNPVTCTGHADLVQTQNGQWFAVFLACQPYQADFFNTGRETFLLPVSWHQGWPSILPPHTPVPLLVPKPNLPAATPPPVPTTGNITYSDEFETDQLSLRWIGLRVPTSPWFAISTESRSLFLEPRRDRLDGEGNPSFLAVRQQNNDFSCEVTLTAQPRTSKCSGGLVAYQNETHYYALAVAIDRGQLTSIALQRPTVKNSVPSTHILDNPDQDPGPQTLATQQMPRHVTSIVLKFQGKGATTRCLYKLGSGRFLQLGPDLPSQFLSTDVAGGFQGVTLGVYAQN